VANVFPPSLSLRLHLTLKLSLLVFSLPQTLSDNGFGQSANRLSCKEWVT